MPRQKQATTSKQNAPTKQKRSKLARENDITAQQEADIKSAWSLFQQDDVEQFADEKEGVIKTNDVRYALRAMGVEPKTQANLKEILGILDPEKDGYVTYPHFLELCALQINNKSDETKVEEVEKAFRLFTKGQDRPITLHDLRSVATVLKEDVSDDVLKAMILEANGGTGIGRGVDVEAFRTVMTMAGIFE